MEAGEIHPRWLRECRDVVRAFAVLVGKGRLVTDLRPEDFQRFRMRLARHVPQSTKAME